MNQIEPMLTIKEAAAIIGMSPVHLCRLIRHGCKLATYRFGNGKNPSIRIKKQDFAQWIESRRLPGSINERLAITKIARKKTGFLTTPRIQRRSGNSTERNSGARVEAPLGSSRNLRSPAAVNCSAVSES